MAIPTFRASGSWTVNTTSPLSATLPTHATGDLLLVEVHSTSSGTTISTHGVSGWTLVGSMASTSGTRRGRVSVYALRATSGAMSNPSCTFSSTGTSYQNRVRAHSITAGTWRDTGTLSDAWEDVTTAQGSDSSTLAFSGLVTTGSDRLGVASVAQCDDTASGITWTNSYATQGSNLDSATGSDGFSSTGYLNIGTAGGTDTTATFTSGGSVSTMGVLFAVRPAYLHVDLTSSGAATVSNDLSLTKSLDATSSGAATTSNALTVTVNLTATATGTATCPDVTLDVTTGPLLLDPTTGTATVSCNLDLTVLLAASTSGAATVQNSLSVTKSLDASASGASTTSGALDVTVNLVASTSGAATTSNELSITKLLTADSSGAATVSASLDLTKLLTADASGAATVSSSLDLTVSLDGSATGVGSVSEWEFDVPGMLDLLPSSGSSTTSASLEITVNLTASSTGQATVSGRLVERHLLTASSTGQASTSVFELTKTIDLTPLPAYAFGAGLIILTHVSSGYVEPVDPGSPEGRHEADVRRIWGLERSARINAWAGYDRWKWRR